MESKKKLKREDFMFQNGWFQQKIKKPGELVMQQFQISDCEQCDIFLFDSAACVYIDECKYCTIFIGASQSSVFVRDCRNLTVVCTTQQFRVRDCISCHFSIFCQSQPIIQSSYDINISCFPQVSYHQLSTQMEQCKINGWNNNWFDVYDFTPHKFGKQNFKFQKWKNDEYHCFLKKFKQAFKKIELKQSKCPIPRCLGKQACSNDNYTVLIVSPIPMSTLIDGLQICQSRIFSLSKEQLVTLKINRLIKSDSGKTSVLFIKTLDKNLAELQNKLTLQGKIKDSSLLQLFEGMIFASFKDEH